MVGRHTRNHNYLKEDEEFESIAYINNKREAKMSQSNEGDNIFAGFDVEGLSDKEKEDLKRVIMESKNDVYIRPHADEENPGPSSNARDIDKPRSPRDIFGANDDSDDDDDSVPSAAVSDGKDVDDDETQPPESMDDMGTFNLVDPTLVDMDENTEDMINDDDHSTHCNTRSPGYNSDNEEQDIHSTQSFSPAQHNEAGTRSNTDSRPWTPASNSSKVPGPSRIHRAEIPGPSSKHTSQISGSSSQHSQHTRHSQHSNKTAGSSSHETEIDDVHVPLRRHYRAVSTQTPSTNIFFSKDGKVTERSVKAVCQLFDIFRMKLKKAQQRCRDRIPYGEPIKPGSHQTNSIDVKKRGQDSICINLSDDDDNDFKTVRESPPPENLPCRRPGLRARKRGSYSALFSSSYSDDELPDLIIEDVAKTRSESLKERTIQKKRVFSTGKENKQNKSEYSPDFNLDSDSNDFATIWGKNDPKTNNDDDFSTKNVVKGNNLSVKSKKSKNVDAMETKVDNVREKILVEETQDPDSDLREVMQEMKKESMLTVAETQASDDDDEDWLQAEKGNSGKKSNNTKMRTNAHKKVPSSKGSKKGVAEADKIGNQSNDADDIVNHVKNHEIERGKLDLIKDKDMINEIKKEVKRSRKKRKADVEDDDSVHVGDTQDDSNAVNVKSKRGRKGAKRKCFQFDSCSSPEVVCIADSQDKDESLEQQEKTEGIDDLNDIENESRSETRDKRNDFSEAVGEACDNDQDEGSQSPVIKRSKKSTLKGEGVVRMNEKDFMSKTSSESVETFIDKKQSSARAKRSNIKRDLLQNESEHKTEKYEIHNLPKGAQNFLSRPISAESIESKSSDDISIASSQRSGMIIDEQGDLYSTQFCEIKDRKRKLSSASKDKPSRLGGKMDVFDEVMRLEEPDSVDLNKETDKCNNKSIRQEKTRSTGKKKLYSGKKMDDFVVTQGGSTEMPINLDSDSDEAFRSLRESHKEKSKKSRRVLNDKKQMDQHFDKSSELDVDDVNNKTGVSGEIDATESKRIKTSKIRSGRKGKVKIEDKNKASDLDLYGLDNMESDVDNNIEDIQPGLSKRGRTHAETYLQRFGKLSERNNSNNSVTDSVPEVAHVDIGRTKIQHEGNDDGDESTQNKIETTECPLCNQLFSNSEIENHAADCNGPLIQDDADDEQSKSSVFNLRNEPEENVSENNNVAQTDSDMHNFMVLKPDEQESELKTCWICGRDIKEQYKLHLDRCIKAAEKQQREIDANGYKVPVDVEQPSPARTTRSRIKLGGDNLFGVGSTYRIPRTVVNNVNESSERDEMEVTPTQGRRTTRKKGERTTTSRSATTTEGQK